MRRIAAGRVAATLLHLQTSAQALRSRGQCVAAAKLLRQAIALGNVASRADLADMLHAGREGLPRDLKKGYELAVEGVNSGCHHCAGVASHYFLACNAYMKSKRHELLMLQLARDSAARGSRFCMSNP